MEGHDAILRAVKETDAAAIRRLVANGADPNGRDAFGDPLLFDAVESLMDAGRSFGPARYGEILSCLVASGADPRALGDEDASILTLAIFERDAAMVEALLAQGVDPDRGRGEPCETIYDLAEFDHLHESRMQSRRAEPGKPASDDPRDADAHVRFLDEQARRTGGPRPRILFLLRRSGALTGREMAHRLGGDSSAGIVWRDDGWHLEASERQ